MVIYVWPNGNWIYDWETTGFTLQHKATLAGGRWVNLDQLYNYVLTTCEQQAINEALGE